MGMLFPKVKNLIGVIVIVIFTVLLTIEQDFIFLLLENILPLPYFLFLLSFLGSSSIIIPVPYQAIIILLITKYNIEIFSASIIIGFGSALGELVGYFLGYFLSETVDSYYKEQISLLKKIINEHGKYIIPTISFIIALTPLPDDLFFIPLGILRFNILYALLPSILGKVLMSFFILLFGKGIYDLGVLFGIPNYFIPIFVMTILVLSLISISFIKWKDIFNNLWIPKK